MADVKLKDAVDFIIEINNDDDTPKNIREKMSGILDILKEDVDDSIKKNKALNELDEIVSDNNMQQYTRTQIWNIVSLLEKL
ncbi:hypothetical protein CEE44_00890 [Candidatus Woesearchaeota archaeon B3_Woes]|nr:MAG: hypothetical protein CEE44_00890 [Candidatus Woesearchaeota archaeon B3_Woes]